MGYKRTTGQNIWFVGVNLPYHAFLTHDERAVDLLADLLGLTLDQKNQYEYTVLKNYQADYSGYQFDYALEESQSLLVPVAYHDGTQVAIDGQPVIFYSLENLVVFEAPSGNHQVSIWFEPPPIYLLGKVVSLGALMVLGITFYLFRKSRVEDK